MDTIYFQKWFLHGDIRNKMREGFSVNRFVGVPNYIASFLISLISAYLCWHINENSHVMYRVMSCIFAFTFSGVYLVYYYMMHYRRNEGIESGDIRKIFS